MCSLEKIIAKFIREYSYEGGNLYKNGRKVGYFDKGCGYVRTKVSGKGWLVHRIIFAMHHGYLPKFVDHINRDKTDNRIENLREATRPRNVVNSNIRNDNTQGFRGIVNHKQCKGWTAQGSDEGGKRVHLGVFTSKEEAALAYNIHAEKVYGKFAEFNKVFEDVKE